MRILKLLNRKYLSIVIVFLFLSLNSVAEDQPIDIWNIDKNKIEIESENISSTEKIEAVEQSNIYKMQTDKKKT